MRYLNPYRLFIDSKNFLYNQGVFSGVYVDVPVISVGNLTTGGTGKTPVVIDLIKLLQEKQAKKNILVVSKSYKASLRHPEAVDLSKPDATAVFGDEPCLIKMKYPHVHVWAGPNKSQTLQKAFSALTGKDIQIDAVVVDDGFSHRKIKRVFDLVLIDMSQPMSHYELLPFGHLREDIFHALRAQLVILTKVNNADPETLTWFRNFFSNRNHPYIETKSISKLDCETKQLFLFSGIGNSKQLQSSLEKANFQIQKHIVFKDHHNYSEEDQLNLLAEWAKSPGTVICTTEKDFIKLTHPVLKSKVKVISLQIEFNVKDRDLLNEKIGQIL